MFHSKEVAQTKHSIALERLEAELIVQTTDPNDILNHCDKKLKISAFFF